MGAIIRAVPTTLIFIALLLWAPHADASSSYFTSQCAPCHDAAAVGSTATTCNGCHSHGTHPDSSKSSINLTGTTNATSYAPGATVSVTINGGYRTGWVRAYLYDQTGKQLAISTGPNGMGGGASFPITLTGPAPTTPGTYTWKVAWYGNKYDASGAAFGASWTPDPNNPNHGQEIVSTNSFTVTAPSAPTVALNPGTLNFGNVNVGATGSLTTQLQNTGTAALTVSAIGRCASPATSTEFAWSSAALPITVNPGSGTTLTVTYTPTAAGGDTGCIALTTNASNGPTTNLAVNGTGVVPAAPKIAVSPTALAFGNVTSGATSAKTFTISNTGSATLTGSVARASGTSAEYTFTPATFSVAAGGSQTVTVTYAPVDTTADAGSLTVTSNDTTSPSVAVSLSGTGVAAPAPSIALSPSTLALGTVTVGSSASLTTQVKNAGTAPLNVTAANLCTGTSAEFAWSPAAPFTVAAGGSTTVTVSYKPTAAGTDSGCIAFTSNDTANPQVSLSVSGTGQAAAAPKIAVAPTSLAFGNVTVGSPSSKTFTISNSGTASLTGTVAAAAGTSAEYAFSPATINVAAGGSQVVTVTYTPTGTGTDSGALAVASNDTTSPTVSVSLSGAGVTAPAPAITLAPNALAFGSVIVGQQASLTAQIRNGGTAALSVTGIAACAGTSAEFGWSHSAPLSVAAGQSATITVTYRPTAVGTDSGCLAISSNDAASPTVNLGLSGSGAVQTAPAIALDPAALDFGTVTVGGSASKTAVVKNTGTATLNVTGIAPCSGTSSAFSWTPAAPLAVAPGQGVTVTVTYKPSTANTDSGCVAFSSNDAANPQVSLSVTGTGTQPPVPSVDADLDIDELKVPGRVDARAGASITPRIELENRSPVEGTGTATLVGTLAGVEVYRQTIPVTVPALGEGNFAFPAYDVSAGSRGTISWTATVVDQDPDVDSATGATVLAPGGGRNGWNDRGTSGGTSTTQDAVTAGAASGTAGGCNSGGTSGLLGFVVATMLLALRRRLGLAAVRSR
ncbi:choice-of-anchor D domain-containing protein [Anaeromyxobacter oryzae]|uniref:Abnormal spindle-like microcephaly-associated protein ASH domain-containing protein n=1 Tax=Anaeromyxobacter oryzae TaxID=2918170 RepID=A0ABM7WPA7_9BACT|nr:choice-of-anchor D domain-containing protein [Anaeromyxobacter oryzae]BDG01306.1 hypothetical protein AMOR_03020 [Anaeromyxobacter oryzae]